MKYFGTDGIRGIANKSLNADFALKLGKALGVILEKKDNPKILIGTDNRISKDLIKYSIISGLLSFNVNVVDCSVITTPAISYLTKQNKFDMGIMISASHNSYEYNGIKIFNNMGEKIDNELENKIEYLIDNVNDYYPFNPFNIGKYEINNKIINKYINFLKKQIKFKNINNKIIIDCSNGAGSEIIKLLFKKFKNVKIINTSVDGKNINLNCGATNLKEMQNLVPNLNYNLGFSLDGDADRLILTNNNGKTISGDEIIYIFAKYYKSIKKLKNNTIVNTIISNYGLDLSLKKLNINTIRSDVGDKNVYQILKKNKLVVGGEQSGHIILRDKTPCGDGILNIIMLLNILQLNNTTINEELISYTNLFQTTNNIKLNNKELITKILNNEIIIKNLEDIENELGENGRILIRKSGTEPVIRILVESFDEKTSKDVCNKITNVLLKFINLLN